jgi:hypothetical protein
MHDLERLYGMGGYIYDRNWADGRMGDEVLEGVLAGSGRAEDEEVDVCDEKMEVREREGSPVYPRAVLVDEHDDILSDGEEWALERAVTETYGGFTRAYPLSAAEARAMGVSAADERH